ncbi:glyoxylase 3 [Culex quinquefasciatus]|uniref:Glyoxylase 3 n=1 Tax=Culex quinquefasciatus TaxID=7176 RepID=B0XEW1_CULQU|nr:glyoxylase 3 [Culex quinquefasciatus]|eukprot:XP_001868183.1 glyoxylase 3 [Culex quinquefasciatus]
MLFASVLSSAVYALRKEPNADSALRNFNPQHLPHQRFPVGPNHVLQVAKEAGVTLSKVLTTHHQWDHAGGNADLWKRYQADLSLGILSIYDGNDDRINNMTYPVGQDDTLENGAVPHNVPHLLIHRDPER